MGGRCSNWCGIWYWTTYGKRPSKAKKPYTGEAAYLRMRAMYFCSRACAIAGTALAPPPPVAEYCPVGCRPECATCGRRKKPVGRDSMDNGLCDWECPGYRDEPTPCDLWPGEKREPPPPPNTEQGSDG